MERRFLTANEASDFLRTTPGQLANLRLRGKGPPYYKFSRKILYCHDALEDWVTKHKKITSE